MKVPTIRADQLILQKGFASSLKQAQALILSGKVIANDQRIDKAGQQLLENAAIRIKGKNNRYVSRGGLKLAHGLSYFDINVNHLICADIGASTGGFTDCLLQHGAKKVYAVDVGYGQLDWKLRQDSRVIVLERVNARKITSEHIPEKIDIIVIDASFISLLSLIPLSFHFLKIKINRDF